MRRRSLYRVDSAGKKTAVTHWVTAVYFFSLFWWVSEVYLLNSRLKKLQLPTELFISNLRRPTLKLLCAILTQMFTDYKHPWIVLSDLPNHKNNLHLNFVYF